MLKRLLSLIAFNSTHLSDEYIFMNPKILYIHIHRFQIMQYIYYLMWYCNCSIHYCHVCCIFFLQCIHSGSDRRDISSPINCNKTFHSPTLYTRKNNGSIPSFTACLWVCISITVPSRWTILYKLTNLTWDCITHWHRHFKNYFFLQSVINPKYTRSYLFILCAHHDIIHNNTWYNSVSCPWPWQEIWN